MPLEVNCPKCAKNYRFDDKYAGRLFQCKACQQEFLIGTPTPPSPASPAAAPQIQVPAGTSKGRRNKITQPPSRKTSRPWLLGFILDFDFKYYFTGRLIRIIWIILVAIYVTTTITLLTMMVRQLPGYLASFAEGKIALTQLLRENAQLLIAFLASQVLGLIGLLLWRVLLELFLVCFNIAETLETIEEKL